MGTYRWKKYKIELLPIKIPTEEVELKIESLVDHVIKNKKQKIDTSTLESEIDQLVYQVAWIDGGGDRDCGRKMNINLINNLKLIW